MQLTEEEQRYLQCLASGMAFEEMAAELGWTHHEVVDFGHRFFGRGFECFWQLDLAPPWPSDLAPPTS